MLVVSVNRGRITIAVIATAVSLSSSACTSDDGDDSTAATQVPASSTATSPPDRSTSPIVVATSTIVTTSTVVAPTTIVPTSTDVAPSTSATTPPPTAGQFNPVPDRPPPTEPVTETQSSATTLRAVQTCDPASPSTPAITLGWQPGTPGAQLVAVATLPDGFATNRYTVSAELPAEHDAYALSPIEPGGIYYWRVLTRTGNEWTASEIATFTGPTCILDAPSSP